jgi:hypothetical protein
LETTNRKEIKMSEYDEWTYHNTIADIVDFMVMNGRDRVLKDIMTRYYDVEECMNPSIGVINEAY